MLVPVLASLPTKFDTLSQSSVMVDTLCSSTHSEDSEAPYGVVLPDGHAWQVSDEFAPVAELYRPATQSVQVSEDSAAEVDEYFPASQSVQLEDAEELKEPASQAKQVLDAAELYRPATQSMQDSAATAADAYFPAGQI